MQLALIWAGCLVISAVMIRLSMGLAHRHGIVDLPGGHKQHLTSTPFVGGVGIFAALSCTLALLGWHGITLGNVQVLTLAVGAGLIFITGLLDDMVHLSYKSRFVVQAVAAMIVGMEGGVLLQDLGELVPGAHATLGWTAPLFSAFATIGVINALNMIDGIDGLSGLVSLVSLLLTAAVALMAGYTDHVLLLVALMGAVAGFLYFNLRYPGNQRARVFLGDNGSMLLGFIFAWSFISLSQGEHRAMTPVTALWIFAIPLMDTVGVMLRRVWLGKSPFRPDRHHLHHLFMRASFRVSDTVYLIALLQLGLGAVGLLALYWAVPEYIMFWLFLAMFAGYFLTVARPWRFVPTLRRLHQFMGLSSVHARGIFIGYFTRQQCPAIPRLLASELGQRFDYQVRLYESDRQGLGEHSHYAVVEIMAEGEDTPGSEFKGLAERIRKGLRNHPKIQVRQFVNRDSGHDRRVGNKPTDGDKRRNDRRKPGTERLLQALEFRADPGFTQEVPA